MKVLLARGADKDLKVSSEQPRRFGISLIHISAQDQDGNTPLQLAEISENDELIALLRA